MSIQWTIRQSIVLRVALVCVLLSGWFSMQSSSPIIIAANQMGTRNSTNPQVSTLLLNANALVLASNSGQAVVITLVRDVAGQPVPGATVQFSSILGTISPSSATTDSNGMTSTTFTAGNKLGQAIISAESNSIVQTTAIQINDMVNRGDNTLSVQTVVGHLKSGEQTVITARLRDAAGQPLRGELVTFFGSLGEIVPASALTDENGQANSTFIAGKVPGQARVVALAGYIINVGQIQVESFTDVQLKGNLIYLPLIQK